MRSVVVDNQAHWKIVRFNGRARRGVRFGISDSDAERSGRFALTMWNRWFAVIQSDVKSGSTFSVRIGHHTVSAMMTLFMDKERKGVWRCLS